MENINDVKIKIALTGTTLGWAILPYIFGLKPLWIWIVLLVLILIDWVTISSINKSRKPLH